VVQQLLSLQTTAVPGVQVPLWQVSAPLQALPSPQLPPLVTGAFVQAPVAGAQVSVVHVLPSLQLTGAPAAHVPPWHVSAPLQAFPSPHAALLATADHATALVADTQA
jgi:hypothetical protein